MICLKLMKKTYLDSKVGERSGITFLSGERTDLAKQGLDLF